jgi:hypothetical protein
MIDHDEGEPVDLSAFGQADASQHDRIIDRAMARVRATRQSRSSLIGDVGRWWYPAIAAAAVLVAVAGTIIAIAPPPVGESALAIDGQLLEWASAGRVPTNGDLLASFRAIAP